MTSEKRFYIKCDEFNAWSVWEADKDVVVFDLLKSDAQLVCDKLNEQHEQIQELKNEVFDWKASAEDYLKLGKSLKKENEQLRNVNVQLVELLSDIGLKTDTALKLLYGE